MTKTIKLPPRTKLHGFDYAKACDLVMTGREWHQLAKRESFKTERGSDAAWGSGFEIYLDGTPRVRA